MKQEVFNFGKFYSLFNRLPLPGADREEYKRSLVLQYTGSRTDSLREMTRAEYAACCAALERLTGREAELKKQRSICLKLMLDLGINTGDWARVNEFCMNPRIAGKPFARISPEGLMELARKLRGIRRKGGLKPRQTEPVKPAPERMAFMLFHPDAQC